MRHALFACLVVAMAPAAVADESLADRVRAVCDAVQKHHVEAPTRQQMIHAGIVAMYRVVEKAPPRGLGERISGLTTHEQFAALLAEVRPKPGGRAKTEADLDQVFLDGLSAAVPGGLRIMEAKESKVAEQLAGNRYVGIQIAAQLDKESKLPQVAETFEGGPAQRAGMKKGDVIEAVDGEAFGGGTLAEYIDKIRGEEGTPVTVTVRRAGAKEPLTFRMTREAMRHPTTFGPEGSKGVRTTGTVPAPGAVRPGSFQLAGAEPIGYLKIQSLLASTPRDVREAAAKMEAEGLQAVVIDMRGVEGGELHSAVVLADELLDSGTIGRVRLASRDVTYRAEPGLLFAGWPMAVLVNEKTSDHAEWIVAALKENKRATIVGTATEGLGISRSTVPLGQGGRTVSLVTALLEKPDGHPIGYFESAPWRTQDSRLGVTPDVAVGSGRGVGGETRTIDLKAEMDALKLQSDKLDAALETLRSPARRSGSGGRAAELEAVRERLNKAAREDTPLKTAVELLTKAIRRPEAVGGQTKDKGPVTEGRGSR